MNRRVGLPGRWRSPPRRLVDWAPVVVIAPTLVLDAVISHSGRPLTVLNVACAVFVCLPLAARRRLGLALMVGCVIGGVVLVMWQLHPGNTVVLIPVVAVYEFARRSDRRVSVWLAAICVPGVLVGVLPFSSGLDHTGSIIIRNLVICWLAVAAGDMVRTGKQMSERAADLREQQTLRRVADERLAIAHEIHDVVAHGMTAINVQAGVAAHLLDRDPEQARGALRDIKRVSGEALDELRGTLSALRDPSLTAPLEPAGRLHDLSELLDGVRAAGVEVTLQAGALGELAAPVDHTGYRIVQEALTNVTRHSGARRARVSVTRRDGTLCIEVADDGRGADAAGVGRAGNGVRGMRERALALGGTLQAGPGEEVGWSVRAQLPLGGAA